MTIANYQEEFAAIARMFSDAWAETVIAWENMPFTPPSPPESHVEFYLLNGEASQASIGAPGSNVFRHVGLVSINVFTPESTGKPEALRLADTAAEIFRNQVKDAIRFKTPKVTVLGVQDHYYQVNVSVPFTRDSFL